MPQPLPPGAPEWQVQDQYLWLGSIGWYGSEKIKEFTEKLRLHRLKFRKETLEDLTAELGPEAALRVFEAWTRPPEPPVPPEPAPSPKRDPYERRRRLGLERKYSRVLLPVEISAVKSIDRYLEEAGLPSAYFLGHQLISMIFPGVSDYIDTQAPQWVRDMLEYGTAVAVGKVLKARRAARPVGGRVPKQRIAGIVAGKPVTEAEPRAAFVARIPTMPEAEFRAWMEARQARRGVGITAAELVAAGAALLPPVVAPQLKPGAAWLEKRAAALFGVTR